MKSKTSIALILIFSGSLVFNACKHEPMVLPATTSETDDNGTENNNGNGNGNGSTVPCDPNIVYFQNDILPIFVTNCAMTSCHDAQSHQEDIVLDSYINIINTGDIDAFDPGHGKIYESITENDLDERMPPTPRPELSEAQINLIATWINQGALNNVCVESAGCDTANVTYSGIIIPLIQSKCIGCHNNASAGGNVNLSSYSGVQTVALNGRLLGAVNHTPGFFAMPKNQPILPSCELAQIRIWIQNGSPNN